MAKRLRVMTYNMHSGRGTDDRYDLGRVAAVIRSYGPDLVALQEVDHGRAHTSADDQSELLGAQLGMQAHFAPTLEKDTGRYGIATLTRLPTVEVRKIFLPAQAHLRSEPRCALATRHMWDGGEVELINTHLSTLFRERPGQVAAIAAEFASEALVICGDFNMTPWSSAYRLLKRGLRSATFFARTWPSYAPIAPIDHILFRGRLELIHGGAWRGGPAREASDHLPVVAELEHLELVA